MKLHSGIVLLLLAALTNAAPSWPSMVQAYQTEHVEEEPPIAVDFWPQDDLFAFDDEYDEGDDEGRDELYPDLFDTLPFQGSVNVDIDVNQDNIPVLVNDTITNIIFKDLEQRIAEDVRRMQEDFILFQRLFGQSQSSGRRPSWFMPWGSPDYAPDDSPVPVPDDTVNDPSTFAYNPLVPNNDNEDDDFLSGFPFLGMNRPLFPGFPGVPGVGFANPDDLPDNYSNETHEVHSVDGSQVVVNNTINKSSGDDFNSFFHHQVIHFKPNEETDVPEEGDEAVTEVPVKEVPQEEEEEEDNSIEGINTVLPTVENEISFESFSPEPVPVVNPKINSDTFLELDGMRPEEPAASEEEFESSDALSQQADGKVAPRSLREFNPIVFPADDPRAFAMDLPGPKSSAYVSNSLDGEDEFEEIESDDSERKAPDLSNDTRVNRIHANKQGMILVDEDAEIFNYGLVMKEAQSKDGDI